MAEATPRTVLRINCTREQAELVADRLLQFGASAVAEDPGAGSDPMDRVWLTGDVHRQRVDDLRVWVDRLVPRVRVEFPRVDPTWADAWREHATAVVAGPFVVRPPWVDPEPEPDPALRAGSGADQDDRFPIELVVDPGRAFGSGSHVSTRLCLELLAVASRGGERMLDVGCGSGVLSVAALRLGAVGALGLDTDPAALEAACVVAEANGMADSFESSDSPLAAVVEATPASFDLVAANLLIPIIEELGPWIVRSVAPGGTVVVGGLLTDQRDRALAALAPLEPLDERVEGGWLSLALGLG